MSVSIVVVIEKHKHTEKVKNCWSSLKLKYKDVKTIEFVLADSQRDGVNKATQNVVFITPCNMLPTYHTMLILEQLKPTQCLMPLVHGSDRYAGAFSINKKQYKGETAEEWSSNEHIEVIESTMYEV